MHCFTRDQLNPIADTTRINKFSSQNTRIEIDTSVPVIRHSEKTCQSGVSYITIEYSYKFKIFFVLQK